MAEILNIRMQSHLTDCSLCGEATAHRWGIPTCNGDVVSNDFPDDLWQGSVPVCQRCYERHARGEIKTFDHYYVRRGPMGVCLIDGAGI